MRFTAWAAAAGVLVLSGLPASPEEAERFHQKLLQIISHGASQASQSRETTFTEAEANAYLQYKVAPTLPNGVTDPSLSMVGQGRVRGRAIVDLDQVRKQKSSGGWFDPTAYLTGKLPVTAAGVLTTNDGSGRFQLDTAEVSGIPVPKVLIKEIVAYYTRSVDHPQGIDFEQPFQLPAGIDRIDIDPGKATVVQ
jgi:hypothetical protein